MPTPVPGSKLTKIEQSMIDRISGKRPDSGPEWQGPSTPMKPLAPEKVKGRAFDYVSGWNLNPRPRSEAGQTSIDFYTLRRMADPTRGGLDLARLAIETRKDQMASQKWDIVPRDKKNKSAAVSGRADELRRLLRYPDGVTMFAPWQRSLLEDRLVIDAATIYPRPTGSGIFLAEVVDGATIKRLLAEDGRVPLPPLPAFQQHLKGMAAADFTLEELIYAPFNIAPDRVYALSPMEQVINIVNLGLRRMLSQVAYYTDGNMPQAILTGPEGWDADQVKDFQEYWDSVMEGNEGARRHGRWVPNGTTVQQITEPDLQDPIDEWLARVICWCFSLSPQVLVKEVNRATAETSAETAKEEGLEPLKTWWKDLMDVVLDRCFQGADFEWAWKDQEVVDAATKATTLSTYVSAKIITVDEAREELGREPLTAAQKAELNPPMPEPLEAPGEGGGKPGAKPGTSQGEEGGDSASRPLPPAKSKDEDDDAEKVAKVAARVVELLEKKKALRPIPRNRAAVRKAEQRILSAAKAYLVKVRKVLVSGLMDPVEKVAKGDKDTILEILATVPASERKKLEKILREELETVAEDGAEQALRQVLLVTGDDVEEALDAMLSQANVRAIAWAEDHAAKLVTRIDDTTRRGIADLVVKGLQEGLSNDALADLIEADDSGLFSESRAEMIARTETAFADVQGNLAGYKESGVVASKQWITGKDEVCDDCTELDGQVVPLDGSFPGGDPPLHPNCRCDILPVLSERTSADE